MIVHAGLIAIRGPSGAWRGILVEGPSGSGKSDLMLRALGEGFRLVADDRTTLWLSDGRLFGRAPETISGLMEVRGVGVPRFETLPLAEVALVVRAGEPERIPDPVAADILGLKVPLIVLALSESSAPAKLGHALAAFDAGPKRVI
ncbi:HPr kinase/phosphorylase [Phenylobacterium sp. J367]|uniref:HPr kinase/phosphorylase n=1 Tax=Phenylobacterium sp. J367 TaxID=2898435 RepID=UPI00215192EB|nr:HPr kinase/phosphorylase [Phenylobacterium sp. J367]MCR5878173.1 HPr kinase/phosphorylase [Phenylobacterium sp. J367]